MSLGRGFQFFIPDQNCRYRLEELRGCRGSPRGLINEVFKGER